MRAMKPCSRFRERFLGWYVLFMRACRSSFSDSGSGHQTRERLASRQPQLMDTGWPVSLGAILAVARTLGQTTGGVPKPRASGRYANVVRGPGLAVA